MVLSLDSVVVAMLDIHQMKKTLYLIRGLTFQAVQQNQIDKACHIYIRVMNYFTLTCHAYMSFRY